MYAVEFETQVKNGTINIPEEYQDRFKKRVRVILMTEGDTLANNFIDELLEKPVKMANFKPMNRDEIHERS